MGNLHVILLQQDLAWENPIENLRHFKALIFGLTSLPDIIVLPEMFSTGFSMQPELMAETYQAQTLEEVKNWSREKHVAICGSIMFKEGSNFYNRFFWFDPNGAEAYYDKAHLFRMGEENLHYQKGEKRIIIEYKGWRIAPFICYDLRFPVWLRRTEKFNYDLLLFVANWPERRAAHWKALLTARAIENQSYVAAVNRIGVDINQINHSGDSRVINPMGVLEYDAKNSNEIQMVELDKEALQQYREQFPVEKDADAFEIL
jgi:omega-amidase